MRLPSLSGLRAFEAAARHLSFKAAAEELSVTPTAISHRIRRLEEELGCELFHRRPRAVALSEAGAVGKLTFSFPTAPVSFRSVVISPGCESGG